MTLRAATDSRSNDVKPDNSLIRPAPTTGPQGSVPPAPRDGEHACRSSSSPRPGAPAAPARYEYHSRPAPGASRTSAAGCDTSPASGSRRRPTPPAPRAALPIRARDVAGGPRRDRDGVAAPGALRSNACGSGALPVPRARSCWCRRRTRSRWCLSSPAKAPGRTVTRSLPPFARRTLISPAAKSRSLGRRLGCLARTRSRRSPGSLPTTSRYRKSSALRAWVWVLALTRSRTASAVRNWRISSCPSSPGGRRPWNLTYRRTHPTYASSVRPL